MLDMTNFSAALPDQMSLTDITPDPPLPEGYSYDAEGHLVPPPDDTCAPTPATVDPAERLDAIAWQINLREHQARDTFRRTALEIGQYLVEAQAICPRGRWGEWLRLKIDYSERKAQQLMQVYQEYHDRELTADYDRLSFTQIYQLLSAPEESRDELARKAAEENLSTRELKAEIDRLRDEIDSAQQRLDIETAEARREGIQQASEEHAEDLKALRLRLDKAEEEARVARAKQASAEASLEAVRSTAARANDDAADMKERARTAEASARDMKQKLADAEKQLIELQRQYGDDLQAARAQIAALKAQPAPAPAPAPGAAIPAAMDRARAAITEAVTAIKQGGQSPEAAKAKEELMLICTAISKKLGGKDQ